LRELKAKKNFLKNYWLKEPFLPSFPLPKEGGGRVLYRKGVNFFGKIKKI
jgi:hypothetical protein